MGHKMNIYNEIFKRIITVLFSIFLITFTTVAGASEASHCGESIADTYDDTFCEQTARHAALEIDWGVFSTASFAKEGLTDKQDAKEIVLAERSLDKNIVKPDERSYNFDDIKTYEWLKPKIIDRSFEAAVNLLDLDGKRDLRSCTLYEIKNLSQVSSSLPKYQLEAMLYFSNAQLGAVTTLEVNSTSNLNSKSCNQLLHLVLGRA